MATPAEIKRHIVEPAQRVFGATLSRQGADAYLVALKPYSPAILARAWEHVIGQDQQPHVDVIRSACEQLGQAADSHKPDLNLRPPRDWLADAKKMARAWMDDFRTRDLYLSYADRPRHQRALAEWARNVADFHAGLLCRAAVLGYTPQRNIYRYRRLYDTDQTIDAGRIEITFPDVLISHLDSLTEADLEGASLWSWWYLEGQHLETSQQAGEQG